MICSTKTFLAHENFTVCWGNCRSPWMLKLCTVECLGSHNPHISIAHVEGGKGHITPLWLYCVKIPRAGKEFHLPLLSIKQATKGQRRGLEGFTHFSRLIISKLEPPIGGGARRALSGARFVPQHSLGLKRPKTPDLLYTHQNYILSRLDPTQDSPTQPHLWNTHHVSQPNFLRYYLNSVTSNIEILETKWDWKLRTMPCYQ